MTLVITPQIGRRRFLAGGLTATGALLLPTRLFAQAGQGGLVATPAQTAGPFYPTTLPADIDNDLVVLRGSDARAEGVVAHVMGRVLGLDGRPIAGAEVEIWQCDAHGRYLHPGSVGSRPRDTAFQGYGRSTTAGDGTYRFRTIRPVPYAGRTPHIHFAVTAPGRPPLVTQMYVAGEPQNAADFVYRGIRDPRQREAVTVPLEPANGIEAGALAGRFDIVLGVLG
ncbi:protocatechuate 3,4-dioxygenase [Chelatococcus sp. SYSU_G07232]|uniref:Protocatechuate 3,4-dioxygenase n=1 Tax=Chelatococcus albus TaxID=3047466 RepID=A0ABT7ALK7_9HYPH|nr:protocatechuate 3,4-dioxygenase [Chelatococcus sp. SYSU_G07232]MDJ1159699.1 protocatechuate 3,4-dioxygenase [Chelatococcus sp. SYSU_G07232]